MSDEKNKPKTEPFEAVAVGPKGQHGMVRGVFEPCATCAGEGGGDAKKVATEAYRAGWDRIFGKARVGQA